MPAADQIQLISEKSKSFWMDRIIVESPAKINLGLNVVGKMNDGYHNIETVFYPIMLSDKIIIEKSKQILFDSDSEYLNNLKDNLILRAIQLMEEKSGQKISVRIFVEKKIPIGGGLGGGSSNAASTLKSINRLYKIGRAHV